MPFQHRLAAFLLLSLVVQIHADQTDAFLTHPVVFATYPAGESFPNYSDRITRLSRALGKRIILPDGASDFADRAAKWKIGSTYCVWCGSGPATFATSRKLLDQDAPCVGMQWTYNPQQDAVAMDFAWHHDLTWATTDIVSALLNPQPAESETVGVAGRLYPIPKGIDSRRILLDALLSKPDNFAKAWKVRFAEDLKGRSFILMDSNLLAARMIDQSGAEHVLVLNSQPLSICPGEGTLTYYVFDPKGQFEQGGVMSAGWRSFNPKAFINDSEKRLTISAQFNQSQEMDQHFILTDKGLILHDAVNKDGSPVNDPAGFHFGVTALHVPN